LSQTKNLTQKWLRSKNCAAINKPKMAAQQKISQKWLRSEKFYDFFMIL
jgi:hypothetical protein